jgi:uncharacterized protein
MLESMHPQGRRLRIPIILDRPQQPLVAEASGRQSEEAIDGGAPGTLEERAMEHLATVQRIYDGFGRGDIPAILEELAEDVAWDQDAPAYGIPIYEPGTGKAHVQRFFEALQDIEFLKFEPTNFLTGGNQVAVTIDIAMRVKSTGNTAEALEIHLWTFGEDGKVSRLFHCIDRHAVALAYGL